VDLPAALLRWFGVHIQKMANKERILGLQEILQDDEDWHL